jgi:hypothetical protein
MKIKNNCWSVNKIAFYLITMATVFMAGCSKNFLDVPPQAQQPTEQFWQSQADATAAVNAMYAFLRSWDMTAFSSIAVEGYPSDDAETGNPADGSYAPMNAYNIFTVTSADPNSQLSGFWKGQYQEINFCNQVLDNVDTMTTVDATTKARYLLEAKFVRAYAYFRLVRAFGDVPLRLRTPADATEYNLPRSPKAEVYAAIEQDLTDAAAGLPSSYTGADVGRATKWAALSLHAMVALYQQKWSDVVDYTNQVIQSGQYSLFPNYEKMYRTANENNSESIFEIQCAEVPSDRGAQTSQYSQIQGVSFPWGGWGFNVPSQNLVNEFETGDRRLQATIIFEGIPTAEGDVVPAPANTPMYNYKSYVPSSEYSTALGTPGCQQNVRVIRYASVLLWNAEANNEMGNPDAALASLEQVRARARAYSIANGSAANVLPPVSTTDKAALRTAIQHERRVELGMDFFESRYFDLIRWGLAADKLGALGWKANKNEVWPVPQSEIDLSVGMLTQNPGYF